MKTHRGSETEIFRQWVPSSLLKSFIRKIIIRHPTSKFPPDAVSASPAAASSSPWISCSLYWRPWCWSATAREDLWPVICLRTTCWLARRTSGSWPERTDSPLTPVCRTEKASVFPRRWQRVASSRRSRPSLCSTRCSSRASTSSTQSAPLLPWTPPSWSSSTLATMSRWRTSMPAWGRWWERKPLPWEGWALLWPWRGISMESMSTWKRKNTVTAPGKSSEWRWWEPSLHQAACTNDSERWMEIWTHLDMTLID